MPKVRRKRRTTTVKRLNRPLKKSGEESVTHIDENKSAYFDLVAKPNESLKSKKTGQFIKSPKIPRHLRIPVDWDVKTGDVISWSQGRPTETYFVTSEQTLLQNPDTSGSGYLTIPLSVTSTVSDAVSYFNPVLNTIGISFVTSIELSPTDAFFTSHFSKEPLPASICNRNDIKYSYDPNENVLFVSLLSNAEQSQQFPLETSKTNDIIQWLSTSNETKTTFTVTFNFEGKSLCSKVPRGIIAGLPKEWKCEQQGAAMFGEGKIQGEWKCQGPEKTKENARKAIEKHYKGLTVEIK